MTDRARILVVEDDPRLRMILMMQLQTAGFDVNPVSSGEEALVLLQESVPDVILLNIQLPGIDGFEVCERIRREQAHIPIVFLTWKSDPESRSRAMAVGADGYITKPWEGSDLISQLERLIRTEKERDRPC